jgi:hypothetical protein
MSEATIKINSNRNTPAGVPVTHTGYGEILANGTVLLLFGTQYETVEITCTRNWALDFAKKLTKELGVQTEVESQIPAASAPFPLDQAGSKGT